jgi:hypothetical protein
MYKRAISVLPSMKHIWLATSVLPEVKLKWTSGIKPEEGQLSFAINETYLACHFRFAGGYTKMGQWCKTRRGPAEFCHK